MQFVSVDQAEGKQRAYRDWSLSRCFSSGSVVACWLEFPLLYRLQLCKGTHFLPLGYPQQILITRRKRGNTGWICPNLRNTTGFSPHAKTTWQKEIYSRDTETGPVATGVLYGRIHFNIALQHSKSAANTPPTHALHILQKHHPRTTITRDRGIQHTRFKKVVMLQKTLEHGFTSKMHQENALKWKIWWRCVQSGLQLTQYNIKILHFRP